MSTGTAPECRIKDENQGGLVSLILLEANQGIQMQQSQELMAREYNFLAAFHIDEDYCIESEEKDMIKPLGSFCFSDLFDCFTLHNPK